MGIPDSILMGKGQLTPEERELMRQHPVYARDMLWPIKFLQPAVDIPYCHHEKWDGTGYPRGLKGMEIPFAARLFMIVDVWDALISDRSYRKALPAEEVRTHLQSESGKHFDPNVVKAFLELEDVSV
jgi:HD-GYP domain-containing protein (c-di-GMP phosphodiesterase class II)